MKRMRYGGFKNAHRTWGRKNKITYRSQYLDQSLQHEEEKPPPSKLVDAFQRVLVVIGTLAYVYLIDLVYRHFP